MRMTPDVPMPSEDYAAGYADGVASLRMIRCLKHRGVLPYNANEIGGGECAACEIDAKNAEIRGLVNQKWVRKEDHDALRADCARLSAEVERHRGLNAVLVSNCERMRERLAAVNRVIKWPVMVERLIEIPAAELEPNEIEDRYIALSRLDAAAKPCSRCAGKGFIEEVGFLPDGSTEDMRTRCPKCLDAAAKPTPAPEPCRMECGDHVCGWAGLSTQAAPRVIPEQVFFTCPDCGSDCEPSDLGEYPSNAGEGKP